MSLDSLPLTRRAGRATVRYLPPYSCDFNPIEHLWALITQRLRRLAPRTSDALRAGSVPGESSMSE